MTPTRERLLWAVALSSFGFNLVVLGLLVTAATQREALKERVVAELRQVPLEPVPLSLKVEVDQQLPIALDVPFDKTLQVPVDLSLPLNTTITVPVEIPVLKQRVELKVPIEATVPVHTSLAVSVREVIPVRATLPVQMDVPVALSLDLAPFRDRVADAAAGLDWGM